jgi:hypothetical protein
MMALLSPMAKKAPDPMSQQAAERRNLILIGVALLTGALGAPLIAAAQAAPSDGARKINLSGRQRMLIQRAGKFVCLAHRSPQPQPLLTAAEKTLKLHQRTEVGLREGDTELGLEPETNALVVKTLTQAQSAFQPYGEVIRKAIDDRAVTPSHVEKIADLNGPALIAMDSAVSVIERIYKSEELLERLAMLINIAGRQRMFIQKMVLHLCLHRSTQSAESRQEFFRTMNRFSVSLNILRRVTPAALPDKKHEPLVSALTEVQKNWDVLRAYMSRATRPTRGQSSEDLLDVDKRAEDLLTKINEIVLLYEGAAR